jgi:hypothetical protein
MHLTTRQIFASTVLGGLTNPNYLFTSEAHGLLAVAHSFYSQWAGRHLAVQGHLLHLYHADSLELVNAPDGLKYPVNDVAFHPTATIMALATGSYDGGAFFEGELLIWNYATNELQPVFTDHREALSCSFTDDGSTLRFTVSPPDDLYEEAHTDQTYEVGFPITEAVPLHSLTPAAVSLHLDPLDPDQCRQRSAGITEELRALCELKGHAFPGTGLIRDLLFLTKDRLAIAKGTTIQLLDLMTLERQSISLPDQQQCVQLFHLPSTGRLLANTWQQGSTETVLYAIDLNEGQISQTLPCAHTFSMNRNGLLFGRQNDWQNRRQPKQQSDFIADDTFSVLFRKQLGHYDLFNHYLRIDHEDCFYFLAGTPATQHTNKALFSLDPVTFEIREVVRLEKHPDHFNNLNGIVVEGLLVLQAHAYSPQEKAHLLFAIDLRDGVKKWTRPVTSQVAAFAPLENGRLLALALVEGTIELIEPVTGQTLETHSTRQGRLLSQPLAMAAKNGTLAVGLTDGSVLVMR